MKSTLLRICAALLVSYPALAQTTTPFSTCPNLYVIAFKEGTNCTANPYRVSRINLAGTLLDTLAITTNDVELNAFGINSNDGYIYGMKYDRTPSGSSCVTANQRLFRYDAQGNTDSLGLISPPAGGVVNSAVGLVTGDNKYVFTAATSSGTQLGIISRIDTLHPKLSISPSYFPITNNAPGRIYADLAISPVDSKLYAYSIMASGSKVYGQVVMLDPATLVLSTVGVVDSITFLDGARDNFGGIMFGADGYMYGVNINTRKFYKIDVANTTTPNITYVSTIAPNLPAGQQIRADLGSCANGSLAIVLPVDLLDFEGAAVAHLAHLSWSVPGGRIINKYTVQYSTDGNGFSDEGQVYGDDYRQSGNSLQYTWSSSRPGSAGGYYRLKMEERDRYSYSQTIRIEDGEDALPGKHLTVYPNPARGAATLRTGIVRTSVSINVYDPTGRCVLVKGLANWQPAEPLMLQLPAGSFIISVCSNSGAEMLRLDVL